MDERCSIPSRGAQHHQAPGVLEAGAAHQLPEPAPPPTSSCPGTHRNVSTAQEAELTLSLLKGSQNSHTLWH